MRMNAKRSIPFTLGYRMDVEYSFWFFLWIWSAAHQGCTFSMELIWPLSIHFLFITWFICTTNFHYVTHLHSSYFVGHRFRLEKIFFSLSICFFFQYEIITKTLKHQNIPTSIADFDYLQRCWLSLLCSVYTQIVMCIVQ